LAQGSRREQHAWHSAGAMSDEDFDAILETIDHTFAAEASQEGDWRALLPDIVEESTRAKAADELGKRVNSTMLRGLAAMLAESDAEKRHQAVCGFASLKKAGAQYCGAVAALFEDADPRVRSRAVYALVKMGDVGARYVRQILPLLEDVDADVRRTAMYALGSFRCSDNADNCSRRLADSDEVVQEFVATALGDILETVLTSSAQKKYRKRIGLLKKSLSQFETGRVLVA